MINKFLNLRTGILLGSFILSGILSLYCFSLFQGTTASIKLEEYFAFISIIFLYFTLLAGPLCYTFRFLPYRGKYLFARRALGVSAFYFGLLHTLLTFFYQLGGFEGLAFLDNRYLFAIGIAVLALLILAVLTITATDTMVERLTFPRWKFIHRFVYLAGILIVVHVLLLGSHFTDLGGFIPQLFFILLAFLLILESLRIDAFLKKQFSFSPQLGLVTSIFLATVIFFLFLSFFPSGTPLQLNIHAQHLLLARQAQDTTSQSNSTIPGLSGDRSKRYSVSFTHDPTISPSTDTQLQFSIFDASSGNPVYLFLKVYEKYLHLVIVDSSLTYFSHIHPELSGNTFSITTQFPKDSLYHLYLDFQPVGAIEQQFAFTLPVGSGTAQTPTFTEDKNLTKTFGNYEVTMEKPAVLSAQEMAIGNQTISFVIKDAKTHQGIKTLKPYLGAFGHLVMINTKTYDYLHVHPSTLTPPQPNENGGPIVSFLPLGLYGPIKPGLYRVFAQFNPDNQLMVANFTVRVQ